MIPIEVLLVHSNETYALDLQQKLDDSGFLGFVALFDAAAGTPTADELDKHDVVLVSANDPYADGALLGDRLADFVDRGGGVVEIGFANATLFDDGLRGRFRDEGYEPLLGENVATSSHEQLVVLDPIHPVLSGIYNVDNGTLSTHVHPSWVSATAQLLADWSDNQRAVAVDATRAGNVVGMNVMLASTDVLDGGWEAWTDLPELFANALWWAARDFDRDGVRDDFDNCMVDWNPDQSDADLDAVGDACDQCRSPRADSDGDGVCDDVDLCPGAFDWFDFDLDGVPDDCDLCPADAPDDEDLDGVCTFDDPCVGFPNVDSDRDGTCDERDLCSGWDDARDRDGDVSPDGCDCEPDDPTIGQLARETCNGLDDDCDGEVDPEGAAGAELYYADGDGDGYGDPTRWVAACSLPEGMVSRGGDCDDQAADIHPGRTERCDGLDNDCDPKTPDVCSTPPAEAPEACGCGGGAAPGAAAWALMLVLARRRTARALT